MRILYVNGDSGIAPDGSKGASIHLRSMIRALCRAGHDVTLCTRRPGWIDDAVQVVEGTDADTLAKTARRFDADAIYERYSLGHIDGLRAAQTLGLPLALEVNAPLVEEAGRFRPNTLSSQDATWELKLWRDADLVFAVSKELRDHIRKVRGHDRGLEHLPNGVDPRIFPSPAPCRREGPFTMGFLGHPKPWHGGELLPHLVQGLERRGISVRLRIVGGGPGSDALAETMRALDLGSKFESTGPLSQDAAIRSLQETDLGLAPYLPSKNFYFCPLKVLETMAAGVPLLATSIGDVPFLAGDAARLVAPGRLEELIDAAAWLLENPEERERLARAGRARAFESFTWDQSAHRVIRALQGDKAARA